MKNKILTFALLAPFVASFSLYSARDLDEMREDAEVVVYEIGPLANIGFIVDRDLEYDNDCNCWTIIGRLRALEYDDHVLVKATIPVNNENMDLILDYIDYQFNTLPKGLYYWESTDRISETPGSTPYKFMHGACYDPQGQRWFPSGSIHPTDMITEAFTDPENPEHVTNQWSRYYGM
jgi:hypothetical protein